MQRNIPPSIRAAMDGLLASCGLKSSDLLHEPEESASKYQTVKEAMSYTGLSRTALWREQRAGNLTAIRYGRRTLFEKADLDEFLQSHKTKKSQE